MLFEVSETPIWDYYTHLSNLIKRATFVGGVKTCSRPYIMNNLCSFVICCIAINAVSRTPNWEEDWKSLAPAPVVSGLLLQHTKEDWALIKKTVTSLSTAGGAYAGAWVGRGVALEGALKILSIGLYREMLDFFKSYLEKGLGQR